MDATMTTKNRYQVYHDGQLEAAIRAKSAREAAKEFLLANPTVGSCTVGEPGGPEKWRFSQSPGFASNPNRLVAG